MKKYLSYSSAANIWDIPYIESVLGFDDSDSDILEFTISRLSARTTDKESRLHLCQLDLPEKAIVRKNGLRVACPELLFLQFARKLELHRLILLGLQLCSHPPGKPSEAITSKRKLESFLAKTTGHYAHSKALRALKYIEDGSASIMESISYMMLTLPHLLGGYGLADAVFNQEINLKNDIAKRFGQKRCFVDLYYKQAKLAVEYDSFTFHNTPAEQGKDLIRATILERHNIEVIRFSTIQLYDKDVCVDFAFNLAYRLGKRIRIRTDKFDQMHTVLRTLLPDRKSIADLNSTQGP